MAAPLRRREEMISQPVTPHVPAKRKQKKRAPKIFTKGEYMLMIFFFSIVAGFAIMMLNTQATITATNKDIQAIESKIEETKKENTDLSIQVSELSTYDRIWEKAKELGLEFEKQNVKVVPGQ
ncbi:cell division protein FtsL [Chungangia koreensis]|uniref:Cell division protein FtsL n=1 Tax=Chungangia koreensis TaxID=752657 RepID=A0ABV8X1F3_9LACT